MKVINVGNPVTREVVPVKFVNLPDANTKEAAAYVEYVQTRIQTPLKEVKVTLRADGYVDVEYFGKGEKFERIRRITGYLVGTIDRWNDAKKAEEQERVKHTGRRINFNEKLSSLQQDFRRKAQRPNLLFGKMPPELQT